LNNPFLTKFSQLKAIEPLKNSAFRWYFTSRISDSMAMNMRQLALTLLLFRLTGSAALLGILVLARAIPLILVTPLAGTAADRIQKKAIIQYSGILNVILAVGVSLTLTTGWLSSENAGSFWILIGVSFLDGVLVCFKGPAADAMIVEVVGPQIITSAVAVNQVGQNTFRLIAPAIAGFLIDSLGFEFVYYAMAALYLGSVLFMIPVPHASVNTGSHMSVMQDTREIWSYIRREKTILYILITVLAIVFFAMPFQQLLPIFTETIFNVSATMLGVMQAVIGIGSIAGSIGIASMGSNKKRGTFLLISSLVLGISLTVFAFTSSLWLAMIMMVIIGVGQSGRMSLPVAMLQSYVKPEFRGRVMSFYGLEIGLSSFGTFFAALLSDTIGVQWSVGGLAICLAAGSLLALLFWKQMRKLD
jgi:MFS family permease